MASANLQISSDPSLEGSSHEPVIDVSNLGKCYKTYAKPSDRLLEWLLPSAGSRHQTQWALRNVNLTVQSGESIAIIGENGAGKSTLLKLLTGVIRPNEGKFKVRGRVRGLLELGLGFHPDFSGLENLRLAGQLQGLTAKEVAERTDWILEFADIGNAVGEPVRTYSSGMQMRLAFAVSVAVRPDVLIVDEALSVGDIFFQQKCFELIENFLAQGTTLLFVTHGLASAYHICRRALFLEKGGIVFDGPVQKAVDLYESKHLVRRTVQEDAVQIDHLGSMQSDSAQLELIAWYDKAGDLVNSVASGEVVSLVVRFRMTTAVEDPHVGFKVRNRHGVVVYETNTYCQQIQTYPVLPGGVVETRFQFACDLMMGEYNVTLGMACGAFGQGSFARQLWYAHGLAPLQVFFEAGTPFWDGFVNLHPHIQHVVLNQEAVS